MAGRANHQPLQSSVQRRADDEQLRLLRFGNEFPAGGSVDELQRPVRRGGGRLEELPHGGPDRLVRLVSSVYAIAGKPGVQLAATRGTSATCTACSEVPVACACRAAQAIAARPESESSKPTTIPPFALSRSFITFSWR